MSDDAVRFFEFCGYPTDSSLAYNTACETLLTNAGNSSIYSDMLGTNVSVFRTNQYRMILYRPAMNLSNQVLIWIETNISCRTQTHVLAIPSQTPLGYCF